MHIGRIFGKRGTINAARYIQTLNKLRCPLHEKRPNKETVILQRNNARTRTARLTLKRIQNGWELLSHPSYSPDLAPSDYHLAGQSRKPCEAVCEELELTSTAEAFLRFCNAGRNAQIWIEILVKVTQFS
jgi:hypothetical protein